MMICRKCGKEFESGEGENGICGACQSDQSSDLWQTVHSPKDVPRDFDTFKKQTGERPGAFSNAVLEHVRSEAAAPLPTPIIQDDYWSLPTGILAWLFSVAALLFFQVVFTVGSLAYLKSHGAVLTQEALEKSVPFAITLLASAIPAHLATLAVAWMIVTKVGRRPFFQTLGWSWHPKFQPWHAAIFVLVMLFGIGQVAERFLPHDSTSFDQLTELVNSRLAGKIILAVLATFTAPLTEEVIYRGVLFAPMERKFGAVWAIIIISLLFAGVHVPQYYQSLSTISVIMILSIGLTTVRAYTRSLLPCVFIHVLFNGIQVLFTLFARQGQ